MGNVSGGALHDLAQSYDGRCRGTCGLRVERELRHGRCAYGEACGVPNMVQVQERVENAFGGADPQQQHEGERQRAPPARDRGEERQAGRQQGRRGRRVPVTKRAAQVRRALVRLACPVGAEGADPCRGIAWRIVPRMCARGT